MFFSNLGRLPGRSVVVVVLSRRPAHLLNAKKMVPWHRRGECEEEAERNGSRCFF